LGDFNMEVTRRQVGDWQEVAVSGRLDAYWADLLSRELGEVISGGARQVRLDLSEVEYLSSAGIRVLLKYYKQLKGSQGIFLVSDASAPVKMVLALAGFEELLGLKAMPAAQEQQPTESAGEQNQVRRLDRGTVRFEIVDTPFTTLACRLVGPSEGFQGERSARTSAGPCSFRTGPSRWVWARWATTFRTVGSDSGTCWLWPEPLPISRRTGGVCRTTSSRPEPFCLTRKS
jgi:anti-anti-sigma factor